MKPSHSATIRIISNYTRLFSTCVIGLFLVRLMLRFGTEAYGLIALLGTGTGIALMVKEIVRTATVPVLGEAFHAEEQNRFPEIFNSAIVCSFIGGLLTLALFGAFALCLPLLEFPQELYWAALIFVAAMGVRSFFTVFLTPLVNFYVVSERMVAYNTILLLERVADMCAAVLTLVLIGTSDRSAAVITYGISSAAFYMLVNVVGALLVLRVDSKLTLSFRHVKKVAIATFLKSVGWNGCVIFALNLHARVDMIIMNLFYGLFGNTVFSLANQAVAYMRQLIFGLVAGVDAVASRVASKNGDGAVVKLIQRSSRLQAIIVFPAMVILFVFAEPLISTWLSGRDIPDNMVPAICWLMRILVFGIGARCLSESWMWILNGAGKVRLYAPAVLIGGILNPMLAYAALKLAPASLQFAMPAVVFSGIMLAVHLVAIPMVVAKEYKLSYLAIVGPLVSPLLVVLVCFAASFGISSVLGPQGLGMLIFGLAFVSLYAVASFCFLLEQDDRVRLTGVGKRLLKLFGRTVN